MSGAQRRKGREGENEARGIFARAGFVVKALQAGRAKRADLGDFVAELPHLRDLADGPSNPRMLREGVTLVCDSKRREKVRVQEWARGIEAIARSGEVPVVVWRSNGEPWRVTLLAEDFARLLTR